MDFYHEGIPGFILPFLSSPEMQRLKGIGMNCGCEYTSFPRFRRLGNYSRYEHSIGAALIVWHFTSDRKQTLAALFHDIASPVFAHSIDFLRGDYMTQETTEEGTEEIIRNSAVICSELERLEIKPDEVKDYHLYPVADNDSPRLSSDRLEYTLGNSLRYGFRTENELRRYYEEITVIEAEDGKPELAFQNLDTASGFATDALRCSRVYVSPEDRYSMQMLSEVLAVALERKTVCMSDLYSTEPQVIEKLLSEPVSAEKWISFRSQRRMVNDIPDGNRYVRVIHAKKRYIDPLVAGKGRLSENCEEFKAELDAFLADPQDEALCSDAYI